MIMSFKFFGIYFIHKPIIIQRINVLRIIGCLERDVLDSHLRQEIMICTIVLDEIEHYDNILPVRRIIDDVGMW